jgi:phosphate uptake regulator
MTDMPSDNKVQLGCGTLIIIAIIVMLFSGGNDSRKLQRQLEELDRKVDRLEKKIDELSLKLGQAPAGTPR